MITGRVGFGRTSGVSLPRTSRHGSTRRWSTSSHRGLRTTSPGSSRWISTLHLQSGFRCGDRAPSACRLPCRRAIAVSTAPCRPTQQRLACGGERPETVAFVAEQDYRAAFLLVVCASIWLARRSDPLSAEIGAARMGSVLSPPETERDRPTVSRRRVPFASPMGTRSRILSCSTSRLIHIAVRTVGSWS